MFSVVFTKYAETHFLKKFKKNYKGTQWQYTEESIIQDLSRLGLKSNKTQHTSQIDELKYMDNHWLAKYDFRIALTNQSTKNSGNRAIIFIDLDSKTIEILLIYNKTDLPKNTNETDYIFNIINKEYPNISNIFKI